jgi:hypothetical protein
MSSPSDKQTAQALVNVIGGSKWMAVALARGYLAVLGGASDADAARIIFNNGGASLKQSKDLVQAMKVDGFVAHIPPRERTGSAANPVTKLFPATITEQRFLESLDEITSVRPSVGYSDDRESGHGLTDFTLAEGDAELPINIKNAGTRFLRSMQLVGLEPDDCIPIPAYKAHAAVEARPSLIYVVSADYDLVGKLKDLLPTLLTSEETLVWDLLNKCGGYRLRHAEDAFIFATVRKYWEQMRPVAAANAFHVISARKALRVLNTKPQRTPGIGLRAWGTGASAEVNVHVSVKDEMTPWAVVRDRIVQNSVEDIVGAVNRKRLEEVYDPEI